MRYACTEDVYSIKIWELSHTYRFASNKVLKKQGMKNYLIRLVYE